MLELADLEAGYGGAVAISGMSFNVDRGGALALLGRNGAGKTTTLKTVMGLLRPTRGTVMFNGHDITGWPPNQIAQAGIGYVPEDRRVFAGLSVIENLEAARKPDTDQQIIWNSERLFELFPEIARRREASAATLSGGEQQMLAIARAMMGNPSFLLLDEPSEGLAPVVVERLRDALIAVKNQGVSILISEQNQRLARQIAADLVIIETGSPAFAGQFRELDEDASIAQRYLGV